MDAINVLLEIGMAMQNVRKLLCSLWICSRIWIDNLVVFHSEILQADEDANKNVTKCIQAIPRDLSIVAGIF